MKTTRLLLLALPLIFSAATLRHQAFGPVKFGMSRVDAHDLLVRLSLDKKRLLNASDVRNHLVINGTKRPGKLVSSDARISVDVRLRPDVPVSEIRVTSMARPPADYATTVKDAWQDFQDIGDSKFTRVVKPGAFPAEEDVPEGEDGTVTDTWATEGIRIELLVCQAVRKPDPTAPQAYSGVVYWAVLRATELPSPK
ncbi:MAG: hypothetical protein ABJF10_23375 [Chthoniobacter sp.]|uniref:hypothetical protein n=1 Tax=Chthoniobacter sp. TaxID=2510640 RepID=UPI0032AC0E9B